MCENPGANIAPKRGELFRARAIACTTTLGNKVMLRWLMGHGPCGRDRGSYTSFERLHASEMWREGYSRHGGKELTLSITILKLRPHFHSIPPFPSRDPGTSREGWKFHGRSREGTLAISTSISTKMRNLQEIMQYLPQYLRWQMAEMI